MIERIVLSHVRCFKSVDVPLKPLTVLIGPNNTGKSTFLTLLETASREGTLDDSWKRRETSSTKSCVDLVADNFTYLGDRVQYMWIDGRPQHQRDLMAMAIRLNDEELARPSVGLAAPLSTLLSELRFGERDFRSLGTGYGAASLADAYLRFDRPRFDRVIAELKALIPGFNDLKITTPQPELRSLAFSFENQVELPIERVSSGVRILTYFVILAHYPKPPELFLVEEPETGLHPRRIGEVVEILRRMARPAEGRPAVQVIASTHSMFVVDALKPNEDQVLVFRRQGDGVRTIDPVDAARLGDSLKHFGLGEIWINDQEDELVAPPRP